MDELKKLKCELCGKECFILFRIEIASDAWSGGKGICSDCSQLVNLDDRVFLKAESFIKEQIASAIERKSYWEDLLSKLMK